jgi:hypothetical protein
MTRLVDPILADLQAEHHEAVAQGSPWRRCLAWLKAIVALARAGAVHSLVVRPYEERRHVGRAVIVTTAAFAGFVAILCAPFARFMDWPWSRLAYFVPYVIPVALPASLTCGIVLGLGRTQHRLRAWILAVSLLASCGSWWVMAVVVPAASRALQEHDRSLPVRPRTPPGTLRTAPGTLPGPVTIAIMKMHPGPIATVRPESRLALACASLALVGFILCVASGQRWVDAGIAIAVVVGYFGSLRWADLVYESQIAKAWAPTSILLVLTTGSLLLRWERTRRGSAT